VPTSGITFELLDGPQAAACAGELEALYAEVCPAEEAARFERRFRVQHRQPGFALAVARHGGYLVAYAAGMPLRPSTSWWRDLTGPRPGSPVSDILVTSLPSVHSA